MLALAVPKINYIFIKLLQSPPVNCVLYKNSVMLRCAIDDDICTIEISLVFIYIPGRHLHDIISLLSTYRVLTLTLIT